MFIALQHSFSLLKTKLFRDILQLIPKERVVSQVLGIPCEFTDVLVRSFPKVTVYNEVVSTHKATMGTNLPLRPDNTIKNPG